MVEVFTINRGTNSGEMLNLINPIGSWKQVPFTAADSKWWSVNLQEELMEEFTALRCYITQCYRKFLLYSLIDISSISKWKINKNPLL